MLKILSDLNLANRIDFDASSTIIASGVCGSWVTLSSDELDFPSAATKLAFPIWTESNRDGTVGWTPDVDTTGKLTVISGYLRGITDQFVKANTAVGDVLEVNTAGKLAEGTASDGVSVAVVVKLHDSVTVLGTTYTDCVEFITL